MVSLLERQRVSRARTPVRLTSGNGVAAAASGDHPGVPGYRPDGKAFPEIRSVPVRRMSFDEEPTYTGTSPLGVCHRSRSTSQYDSDSGLSVTVTCLCSP